MTNRLAKSRAAAAIIAACMVTAGAAPAAGATVATAGDKAGWASVVTVTVPTGAGSVQAAVPGLLRAPVGGMVRSVLCGGCYEAA